MNFSRNLEIFITEFIDNGGWKQVLGEGLKNTLIIAVLGLVIGILIGTLIATVKVMPKYKVLPRILDKICTVYVGFFRGTPLVVQLLLAYYVVWPLLGISIESFLVRLIPNADIRTILFGVNPESLFVCVLVFGLNSAAYVSETMRGGICSVDIGQMEAGRSLGLSFGTTMMRVVVPQAIKNILPTLGNEFIALIKDTSVASFVAAVDLYKTFNEIANVHYEYFVPYLAMAVIYIVLVAIITVGIKLMERGLRRSERNA